MVLGSGGEVHHHHRLTDIVLGVGWIAPQFGDPGAREQAPVRGAQVVPPLVDWQWETLPRNEKARTPPPSTTVVLNTVVPLPASCNDIAGRTPDAPVAIPTSPTLIRSQAAAPTAIAPADDVLPAPSGRSARDRRPTFFGRLFGHLPHHGQDRMGQHRQSDVPIPARPAPDLVVRQPDFLLGRLETALD